jgi:hypothetical protein
MKWLLIFVLFSDGSTDYEIFDLARTGASCEAEKEKLEQQIKYGQYNGRVVVEAHIGCFDTKPVSR